MFGLAQIVDCLRAHGRKLLMRDRQHNSVIVVRAKRGYGPYAVFPLGFVGADPRVVDIDLDVVLTQFAHDIDNAGIALVWTVFLRSEERRVGTACVYSV